jgi:hypothetical protein
MAYESTFILPDLAEFLRILVHFNRVVGRINVPGRLNVVILQQTVAVSGEKL